LPKNSVDYGEDANSDGQIHFKSSLLEHWNLHGPSPC